MYYYEEEPIYFPSYEKEEIPSIVYINGFWYLIIKRVRQELTAVY